MLVDRRLMRDAGEGSGLELLATLDTNIPDLKTAVEVLQRQLSGVWVQPPVRSTRCASLALSRLPLIFS